MTRPSAKAEARPGPSASADAKAKDGTGKAKAKVRTDRTKANASLSGLQTSKGEALTSLDNAHLCRNAMPNDVTLKVPAQLF